MIRERVDTGQQQYEILIGPGLLARTGEWLQELQVRTSSSHLIITDENVARAGHLARVQQSLAAAGYRTQTLIIPAGERSKSLEMAAQGFDAAYQAGLDRRSVVLALGGGVVGDYAGFVAATYMRGIDFIQLPTTLLAHDSAVGGKVAVNLPYAKNMIGAFHQPLAVIYDTETLKTLPLRELRSGLAEAIKHGLIRDRDLFEWIDHKMEAILSGDDAVMAELLARSCRIKAVIVSQDEREQGVRALLNLGHTIGHAIEGPGQFAHGEAVAIGMVAAAELSVQLGRCTPEVAAETERVVRKAGLPTTIPPQLDVDEMIAAMRQDKKATGGVLTFVLLDRIGHADIVHHVEEAAVRRVIEGKQEWEESAR